MRIFLLIVYLFSSSYIALSQKLESSSNFKFQINQKLSQTFKSNSSNTNNKINHKLIWQEFENTTYVNPWLGFNVDSQKFTAEYFWEKDQLIIIGHFGNPDQYAPRININLNKRSMELSFILESEDTLFSLNSKSKPLNMILIPIKKAYFCLSRTPSKDKIEDLVAYIEIETYEYYKISNNKNPTYRKLISKIKGIFPIYYLERCEG